jgi:hypothetical protein
VTSGFILFQPVAICCGLAVTATLALLLLLVLIWFRYQALERHLLKRQEDAESVTESLRRAVGQLAKDVDEMSRRAGSLPSVEPRRCLNLSKRSHALRMHRRGDSPEQIATTLGVARQEIDLLLKVHKILVASV